MRRALSILAALLGTASSALAQPTASFVMRTAGYASSESQGTAPLGVLFDATATTSGGSANAFHDLRYVWDFGDPGSGSWAYGIGNRSKNRAIGPVAGHLYKTPGTYTVKLTVLDPDGFISTDSDTVTVVSPDSSISLANTYCYANASGTFVGCALDSAADGDGSPGDGTCAGTNAANCVVTSDQASVVAGANRRHQLRRGDSFGTSRMVLTSGSGLVEPFGSGSKPSLTYSGLNPIIQLGNNTISGSNYTIQGLSVNPSTASYGPGIYTGIPGSSNITIYDVHATGGAGIVSFANYIHQDIFLQEISGDHAGAQPEAFAFVWCNHCALLGGTFDFGNSATQLENNVRFMAFRKAAISNNLLLGGSTAKNMMTLRACQVAANNCNPAVDFSEFNVVSDNELYASEDVGIPAISLQEENYGDPMIYDILIERNYLGCGVPTCSATPHGITGRAGQNGDGVRVTVRNNIVNFLGFSATGNGYIVNSDGLAAENNVVDDWRIYHNTIYDDSSGALTLVRMGVGAHTVRNNLMYAPSKSTRTFTATSESATFTASNNLRDVSEYTGDPFVTATGNKDTPDEFKLSGSVTAPVNGGYDFTGGDPYVYFDAFLGCRPFGAGWDVGAHEWGAVDCFRRVIQRGLRGRGVRIQ